MAVLNEYQRRQLNEYLLQIRPLIAEKKPTCSEVAEWARAALKCAVDHGNITGRVGPNGKLWEWEWPNTEATMKGRAGARSDMNLALEQLYALHAWASGVYHTLHQYGFPITPPPRLPELKERVELARKELAMTDHRAPEER